MPIFPGFVYLSRSLPYFTNPHFRIVTVIAHFSHQLPFLHHSYRMWNPLRYFYSEFTKQIFQIFTKLFWHSVFTVNLTFLVSQIIQDIINILERCLYRATPVQLMLNALLNGLCHKAHQQMTCIFLFSLVNNRRVSMIAHLLLSPTEQYPADGA